jgi:COP9 signalosome complex subunit 2
VHVAVVAKTATSGGRGDTALMGPEGFGLREDRWM